VTDCTSPSAARPSADALPPTLLDRIFSERLTVLWILNFVAVAGVAAWILCDRSAAHLLGIATPAPDTTWFPKGESGGDVSRGAALRAGAALGAVGLAVISVVIIGLGLFFGPRPQRNLRSWLALTALLAAWMALATSREDLAWRGEVRRMRRQTPNFEPLAARLRADFPLCDGSLPGLGNFTAYPVGNPEMLLMFIAETPPGRATVAAVERSPAGALRFALASEQRGQWLEWHPAGSQPASFKGTLAEYTLDRAAPLGDGWHLTRYQ
jgi:hypothetical protein